MRVLIVGAGPTGLTAAVELARFGVSTEVIDRKKDPSSLSRAVGILPRSLEILTPSGVTERLLAEGIKIREVKIFKQRRKILSLSLRGGHPSTDFGLALAQDRTEAALRDRLLTFGGSVSYGKTLSSLEQDKKQVLARFADGSQAAYDYLIGADGVHSTARDCVGIEYAGFDLPETWSIADVDAADWPNQQALTLCLPGPGQVTVVAPLEATRYRVVSNTADALASLPLALRIVRRHREAQFRISIRQAVNYHSGRVFLAGDAAHCHSPAGGRGMNLGIADAAELAHRMVENRLAGYSASRHAAGARTIAESERLRRLLTSSGRVKRTLTVGAFRLIDTLPLLQRPLARRFLDA